MRNTIYIDNIEVLLSDRILEDNSNTLKNTVCSEIKGAPLTTNIGVTWICYVLLENSRDLPSYPFLLLPF
jgi:hypothetical protein